jgi:hypothetical protein
MRLAAQIRGGFYPAPEQAVALAATFLCPPRQAFTLLDPCAGKGAAVEQLGTLLGCPQSRIYAIELDESRALALHAALPNAHVLAPASFFGCRASMSSFSFIWLNPHFDSGYGGHRVETQFLQQATDWLLPGGVMALVCPEDIMDECSETRRHFLTCYENCRIIPFPAAHRRFHEVIVLGHKRARLLGDRPEATSRRTWDSVLAPATFRYRLPEGNGPRLFLQVEPTEVQLQRLLARSPLRSHLKAPPSLPVPSPPLALGMGHVALLLASGHPDGVIHPEGQPPHVVRGTSRKRRYVSDVTETDNPDGSTTTRTTISERIDLVVRTVDGTGRIQTFVDADAAEE